jgi:hypothetical protein
MKIGLLDVDRHNFPNLALMKLSAKHKRNGYSVEFATIFERYDILYKSKVFTFSADDTTCYNAQETVTGGTGYQKFNKLSYEIEHIYPDYPLYGIDYALGFATRGCIRKCSFCIVPEKEGNIKPNAEIYEFWKDQKKLVFMDNNILAHEHGLQQIENCIKEGIKIDCNQGLDARLIAKDTEIQKLLARTKWIDGVIRLAMDHKSQIESVVKSVEKIREYAGKKFKFMCYILLTEDMEDSLHRIECCRDLEIDPFAQPKLDFTYNYKPPQWQKDMARWCNHRATFKSTEWKDYKFTS